MEEKISIAQQLVLGEILARQARKFPEREAFVFEETRYTYQQFNSRVNRLSHALMYKGIDKGNNIGILFYNCMEIMEAYFAVCRIGAVCVPLNFRLVESEMEYILSNAECKLLIMGPEFSEIIGNIKDNLPLIKNFVMARGVKGGYWIDYEEFLAQGKEEELNIYVEDNDPAFIMYTAGTTGRPKGAVLTHKNQVINCLNMVIEGPVLINNISICIPPLFHEAALSNVLRVLITGGTMVIMARYDADLILKNVEEEKVEGIFLVPSLWNWLVHHPTVDHYDLSSLKEGRTGAAIMPIALKEKVVKKFPNVQLYEAFGQTEMSPITTLMKPEFIYKKPGSVGQPVINVEVRVVDDQDNDVPVGEVGEIVYRGPTVMQEYYKDPEATAEAFRGGWFHSGDLVRQDGDGFFYVVDRKNDMIISGGENIYPAEVEEVLYAHPGIMEAAVIGVPDKKWGESVMAVITLKEGEKITPEEVIEYCKGKMASYKKPKHVEIVQALPRNPAGKVLKRRLREDMVSL